MEIIPWERLSKESSAAFAAFVVFRDLGAKRNLLLVSKTVNRNITTIRGWSSIWNWNERARLWDNEQDRLRRITQSEEIKEMSARHANLSVLLQQKVVQRLQNLNAAELTPGELAKWLDVAVKIERLARGASTENVEQHISGADGNAVAIKIEENHERTGKILSILEEIGVVQPKLIEGSYTEDNEVYTSDAN